MPAPKKETPSESEEPTFEVALAELEELVEQMESDQMPLEELIRNYEKGTSLFRACEKRLDEAEGRIEIIRKNRNGESVSEPFHEAQTDTTSTTPSDQDDTEENGELF
ncbi:MAG: exodeoxyribonuclease VII small subunit [Verrucomicrobiota bacterium]